MGRRLSVWLLLGVFAVLAAGEPPAFGETARGEAGDPRQSTGDAALARGIDLYNAGRADEALVLLRGYVVRSYNSSQLPQAYLYLARIFRDQGRADEALLYLSRIPAKQRTPAVDLVEGASLISTGQLERGLALIQGLDPAALTQADRALWSAAFAEAQMLSGRPLQALAFLNQALDAGGDSEALLSQAHQVLGDQLSDQELAEAAFMFDGSAIGADARLQLAKQALRRGDRQGAAQQIEQLVASSISFPYRGEALQLYDQFSGQSWQQRSVGVILPLTGRYATFGSLVRRGMELALEIHDKTREPVPFIFKDSGNDPQLAVQAVSELAHRDRVMAIAGPLTGSAAEAAAWQAQQDRVPLLALSQREGLPESGPFVFRNSLTARLQVQALVTYAMEGQGLTRFGILHPASKLGQEMVDLFSWEVAARGGEVVDIQGYAEDATDFRRQIKLLQGKDPDAPEEEEKPADPLQEPLVAKPVVPFDALFIPDYGDRVGLIAPQLAFYGIEGVPLLGINGWNSPELLRIAGRYVEGAVFVDGFFAESPHSFVQDFVKLYLDRYGEKPSILEAQGFDAAGILLSLMDRPDVQSRDALWLSLTQLRDYPGVTGSTGFTTQGEAQKVLFLIQVQDGKFVQVN